MGEVLPMPRVGDVFADVRGGGRTMRISYHEERRAVVVSLWVGTMCRGTFRMAADDVGRLMSMLNEIGVLADPADAPTHRPAVSTGEGAGPGSKVSGVAGAPHHREPPFDQTGEIAGGVSMALPPSARPIPGVA
jgi:hypothetical protein